MRTTSCAQLSSGRINIKPMQMTARVVWQHLPWRRVLGFVLLFGFLLGLYRSPWGVPLERTMIERVTVPAAAWFIALADPEAGAVARGPRISSPGGALNVLHGCEGSDAALLLAAALLVAPLPWRWRLAGAVVGALALVVLNLGRVVMLFYAMRYAPQWFPTLHGLVAPLMMVAAACAAFVLCSRLAPPQSLAPTQC
jgi:exosortase/archaeosortase family protein